MALLRAVSLAIVLGSVHSKESVHSGWGMALELSRPLVGPCSSSSGGIAVDVEAHGGEETEMALRAKYSVLTLECSEDAFKQIKRRLNSTLSMDTNKRPRCRTRETRVLVPCILEITGLLGG